MEHRFDETLSLPGRPAGAIAQALQRRAPSGRVLRRGKAGPRLRLAHQQGFSASIMETTCGVCNQVYSEVQDVIRNCATGRRGQRAGARLARAFRLAHQHRCIEPQIHAEHATTDTGGPYASATAMPIFLTNAAIDLFI